ncbi:SDR family NAD(P)-dependent oxidoreductase [Paraburkholderia sp. B3]|uniref:SDR family NAD(P)-dependent oxidoreductase n=1 Tax=Paraburkholderia sp. B3 TaxID=3134791 RepID=UPI003982C947
MNRNEKARTAIVTGAANGIGAATARRFVRDGHRVVLVDVAQSGRALADELGEQTVFLQGDIAQETTAATAVQLAIDRFGSLDTVVNNGGISLLRSLVDMTVDEWERVQSVNLRSSWLFLRAAHPHLLKSAVPSVVNVSSFHAGATIGDFTAYATSKAGLSGFTRSAAVELAAHGIRVNAVAPGVIHTSMLQNWLDTVADPDQALDRMRTFQPLGRLGQPDEVASAIAFLASEDASFVNGTTLLVDGGVSARLWHA